MLRSTYTPPPPLPRGWSEHKAPSGHTYYYNAETKQSTYKRPTAPAPVPQPAVIPAAQSPLAYPPTFPTTPAPGVPFNASAGFNQHRRGEPGGGWRHDRRQPPQDRPKSKHAIPDCAPWVLVKTKLGRRFVHNTETNESFWKFPEHVLKGVVEYDIREREKKERRERGEASEAEEEKAEEVEKEEVAGGRDHPVVRNESVEKDKGEEKGYDDDEYEEVEVTDDEDEDLPSKRPRTEDADDQPLEFNEDDIAFQLAAMGEDYGLDPGEYGEPGDEEWEEGAEGLPLTEEDSAALFRDLLDDYRINPYTPWEKIIEEGKIIGDSRYTVLPNMKSRREAYSNWSRDRIQDYKERKAKEEKKDPRIRYLALLQQYATTKLYWPEFKRKYRKEPEMKESRLSDKDREKLYRDHISRLKLPEGTRKSDLSALLKSAPLSQLNKSTTTETLPPSVLTDLRYISLPPKVRDPLIEAYILTLPAAPEKNELSTEEQDEKSKREQDRQRRERALAEREARVQEEKRNQRRSLLHGKDMLRHGDEEIQRAMRVGKEGLMSHIQGEEHGDSAKVESQT